MNMMSLHTPNFANEAWDGPAVNTAKQTRSVRAYSHSWLPIELIIWNETYFIIICLEEENEDRGIKNIPCKFGSHSSKSF